MKRLFNEKYFVVIMAAYIIFMFIDRHFIKGAPKIFNNIVLVLNVILFIYFIAFFVIRIIANYRRRHSKK